MTKLALLIDTNYLCHRAYHTVGHLTHRDIGTGVAFGVLRDIITLKERFKPNHFAFCFDSKHSLRQQIYPGYKQSRRDRYNHACPDEKRGIDEFRKQVTLLRTDYLPLAGFKNIFCYKGYEADDIIARLSQQNDCLYMIVSSDQDLYQCLRTSVRYYSPQTATVTTAAQFTATWGVLPCQWPIAKAYAGCKTDDIPGIVGVAERSACDYIRGKLTKGKKYEAILAGAAIHERNLPLVRLPFLDTPLPKLVKDTVTNDSWAALAAKLGLSSLEGFSYNGQRTNRAKGVKPERQGFGLGEQERKRR